tara:strand:- start:196 stop:339 length:144 start_codon:yes stop_codon:yes gene_type:complete
MDNLRDDKKINDLKYKLNEINKQMEFLENQQIILDKLLVEIKRVKFK